MADQKDLDELDGQIRTRLKELRASGFSSTCEPLCKDVERRLSEAKARYDARMEKAMEGGSKVKEMLAATEKTLARTSYEGSLKMNLVLLQKLLPGE